MSLRPDEPGNHANLAALARSHACRSCGLVSRLWEALTYATTTSVDVRLPWAGYEVQRAVIALQRAALWQHLARLDLRLTSNMQEAPFALLAAVVPQCRALRRVAVWANHSAPPVPETAALQKCTRLTALELWSVEGDAVIAAALPQLGALQRLAICYSGYADPARPLPARLSVALPRCS